MKKVREPAEKETTDDESDAGLDYGSWAHVQPKVSLAKALRLALRLAWQASPRRWLLLLLCASVSAACGPAILWAGRRLVDLVAGGSAGHHVSILPTVAVIGALAVLQRISSVSATYQQQSFSYRVHHAAEERFLSRAVSIDIPYLDDPGFHDRLIRASKTSMTRPFAVTTETVTFCGQLVGLIGIVGLLSAVHPILLLLLIGSVAVTAAAQLRVGRNVYAADLQNSRNFREMYYRRHLMTGAVSIKDLQSMGADQWMWRQHRELQRWYEGSIARVYRRGHDEALVAGVASAALITLAYWFVARQGLAGQLTAGDLFLVLGAFSSVIALVSAISGSVVALQGHAPYLRDYFDFLDLPPRLPAPADPQPLPPTVASVNGSGPETAGLVLKNVTFSYPTSTQPALEDIDLAVAPGEMLALVGDNGAGKTTLVNLLLRNYDPQEGQVLIAGVDARDVELDELRSRFGVLFQDFVQYNLTVRENLQIGRIEREPSDADYWQALRSASAEFVEKIPGGLDATVGKLYEWGRDISGGQWQRLALARLMYRDADIWILDEPTSALDPEAEVAIFTQLRENLRGRIGIVISHRFSTVRIADRIVVMQDGRITENGTHDELIALDGRYAHLFDLQAAGYR